MSPVVLQVAGVSKRFARRTARPPTLKRAVLEGLGRRGPRGIFWALRDVDLELRAGETLGLIGANGSGKSTLLRLMAGLGRPTRGRITRHRRVDAMLSLGESFDLRLSGRENALTASILAGFSRREARAKLDEIVAFAELGGFLDEPLRTWSDGMRLRLAFAVATATRPEVLLIDEVLSVGDVQFQAKCLERARDLQARGVALVLASHDEEQVRRFCERVVWLYDGRVRAEGRPDEVYAAYRGALLAETAQRSGGSPAAPRHARAHLRLGENRFGTLEVEIAEVRIALEREGRSARVRVAVDLDPRAEVREPIVAVALHRLADGRKILDVNTQVDGVTLEKLAAPTSVALCLEPLDLEPGAYRVDVGVYERCWSYAYDYHWQAYELEVPADRDASSDPPRRWVVER